MHIILLIIIIIFVLAAVVFAVSSLFIKHILEAVPSRSDMEADSPTSKEPEPEDALTAAFLKNRKELRKGGAEFEKLTEKAEIMSKDGLKLQAIYRMQENESHDWIISIHGYKDSHTFMLPYGAAFYKKGYNVLMPDNRAHGKSEGRYIGMGWLDKEDIKEWIKWILSRDEEARIILHGISMGGATVMMTAGENPEHVAGYIEDCGYTSVWDIFACVMKRDYHLPAFPILYVCRIISRKKLKYDYVEASSITQIKKCQKPMLFIHGEKDGFVPTEMGYRVYEAFEGTKELYIAENAGHAESMDYAPETYFNRIFEFIETKINQ